MTIDGPKTHWVYDLQIWLEHFLHRVLLLPSIDVRVFRTHMRVAAVPRTRRTCLCARQTKQRWAAARSQWREGQRASVHALRVAATLFQGNLHLLLN